MANLDTVAKRYSGIYATCPWRTSLPIATGTVGQGPRQHSAWLYSGILASAPVTPTGAGSSALQGSAFQQSAFQQSAFQGSAFG